MTFKIEFKNKKIIEDVLKRITESDLTPLAEYISRMIKVRTRLGYGVEKDGSKREKLKSLKDSTIEKRKRKKNNGELSEFTTPKRSNLTMTGRMLDSIDYAINKLKIVLTIANTSRPDSKATNYEIAKYNTEKGRPFFNVSDSEIRQIKREASRIIKEKLSKT